MEKRYLNVGFLYGQFGRATDWDELFQALRQRLTSQKLAWRLTAVDYSRWTELQNRKLSFQLWLDTAGPKLQAENFDVLIGYSLGGRLLLNLLKQEPKLAKLFVFLSTHPGLKNEQDREARALHDQQWIRRFRTEGWAEAAKAWEAQAPFGPGQNPLPDFSEPKSLDFWLEALEAWSLANQAAFQELIHGQAEKILWIAGQRDRKFADLAASLGLASPALRVFELGNAWHRLHRQEAPALSEILITEIRRTPSQNF